MASIRAMVSDRVRSPVAVTVAEPPASIRVRVCGGTAFPPSGRPKKSVSPTGADARSPPCAKSFATRMVICAGAHSWLLSRMLGEPMPLENERGARIVPDFGGVLYARNDADPVGLRIVPEAAHAPAEACNEIKAPLATPVRKPWHNATLKPIATGLSCGAARSSTSAYDWRSSINPIMPLMDVAGVDSIFKCNKDNNGHGIRRMEWAGLL